MTETVDGRCRKCISIDNQIVPLERTMKEFEDEGAAYCLMTFRVNKHLLIIFIIAFLF